MVVYPVTTTYSITVEFGLRSSIEKLRRTFQNASEVLPSALIDVFKRVDVKRTGNLQEIQIEYAAAQPIDSATNRIDDINQNEDKVSYTTVGGSYLQYYKSYEGSVQLVDDKKTGGTNVILTYKIVPNKDSPDIQRFIDFDISVLKRIDYIIKF